MRRVVLERRADAAPSAAPTIVEPPPIPAIDVSDVAVVLTVHNRPEVVRECLRAFMRHTHSSVRLIVVDDASDAHTVALLADELRPIAATWDGRVTTVHMDENVGYIDAVNLGLLAAFGEQSELSGRPRAEWAVCLNSDTLVTPGWLEHMIAVGREDARIGVVCPWLSDGGALTLRMPPGAGYLETAARIASVAPEACPAAFDAVTPCGACMAVRRSWWEQIGPFDKAEGLAMYGDEDRWWVKLVKAGGLAKIATRAWVWHWGQGIAGPAFEAMRQASMRAFDAEHGAFLRPRQAEAAKVDPRMRRGTGLASRIANVRTERPRLYFWFQSARHCGGVLMMSQICDRLIDRGIDATIVFRDDHFEEWRMVGEGAHFAPMFLPTQDPGDWISAGGSELGVVMASSWFDGAPVKALCDRFPWLLPRVFIQSCDDLTLDMHGRRRWPDAMMADFFAIAEEHGGVCNARWILRSMRERRGLDLERLEHIPGGVDTDLFRPPEGGRPPVFRVLAMHRHQSPERGPDLMRRVLARAKDARPDIKIATYGNERLDGVESTWLGVLSQRRVAEEMQRSHVLLDTSQMHGHSLGLPGLEMMATGGMVVATPNLGMLEYASHGSDAVLGTDERTMVDAIVAAVDDHPARQRFALRARRTAMVMSLDAMADQWAAWYRAQSPG